MRTDMDILADYEANEPDDPNDIDDTMRNRRIARKQAGDAASRGDPVAGMLSEMENVAAPFFLGVDEDPDSSDLDVYP